MNKNATLRFHADPRYDNVVDQIAERFQRGLTVDVDEYARKFPEYSEKLRELLPTMEAIAGALAPNETDRVLSDNESSSQFAEDPNDQNLLRIDEFELRQELGRGGMGIVYEAFQPSVNRRVALKILPFAALLDPEQIRRFRFEAEVAAKLDHPNIVNVFSAGRDPNRNIYYFAMEYVEGPTVAEVIEHMRGRHGSDSPGALATNGGDTTIGDINGPSDLNPPMGTPQSTGSSLDETHLSVHGFISPGEDHGGKGYIRAVAALIAKAARGLDYAHRVGVIHRDIKPGNLMIDDDGEVIITDFGLAHIECDVHLTNTFKMMGTLPYMSPEQAFSQRATFDHRSDIYSLGATLYELLTLRRLVAAPDPPSILRAIAETQPPSPRKLNHAIPRDLERIVSKATEKDPLDRYSTAEEFAEDLERFLTGQPTIANPPSVFRRSQRWLKQPSRVFLLVGTLVIAMATVLLGVWSRSLAEREADLAEQKAELAGSATK